MDSAGHDVRQLVRNISLPIHESKGWLKFLGVISIVSGVLTALSLVGIIVAWLPIWMGFLLYQGGSLVEQAYVGGDPEALTASLGKLRTYFTVTGVLALVGFIGIGLLLLFGLFGAMAGMQLFQDFLQQMR